MEVVEHLKIIATAAEAAFEPATEKRAARLVIAERRPAGVRIIATRGERHRAEHVVPWAMLEQGENPDQGNVAVRWVCEKLAMVEMQADG